VEPNFELFAHSVIHSFKKSKIEFERVKTETGKEDILIKDIYFLKGVSLNRNDNYSADSYMVSNDNFEDQKVIEYILNKREGERYPESEWMASKGVVARFETIVNLPFFVDIIHPNRAIPNVGLSEHEFVFEMDLKLPPKYAEFSLSQ